MAGQRDRAKPIRLFYSYSHKDEVLRLKLETHLAVLRRAGMIAEWHDRKIEAGDDWKGQIDRHLTSADIVLLLVSSDFIASDYCWGEEMTKARERHERGEARVIPVILRHCRWQSTPLARLQAIPKEAKPIKSWPDEDEAFDDVVAAIERSLEEARQRIEGAAKQRAKGEARQRAEEQARQRAEEQERRLAEEERQRAEEQARQRAEEQARQRAEEQARQRAEQQERRRAEEERQRAEEQERRLAEEERQRAEEQARQRAEQQERRRAEEERQRAEEERQRAEEQVRQRVEQQARQRAEEEARRLAEHWGKGYLRGYGHDIFVSYAHSGLLKDWSRRLIGELRALVAQGLNLRSAEQVGVWWDYDLRGNQPLTRQLREKVEDAGILLVLMSDWYLDSAWCRDERNWFVGTVRQKGADRVFVVRVCATDHGRWPEAFKDERGHPLVQYDFVRDADALYPKGYPTPEDSYDSKEYYAALRTLARDIVSRLKALQRANHRSRPDPQPPPGLREQVFLAAVPEEDYELREELAALLRENGCVVVPERNPLDPDEVHERAPEWISNCDKFVQVLGRYVGRWRHEDTGFVMYQHALARKSNKPIFVYRSPHLNAREVRDPEYREFLEGLDQDDTGDLQSFAERVVRPAALPIHRSVFMIASARDEILERNIRRMLDELDVSVFPLYRSARVLEEGSSFLEMVRRCDAILLINGNIKEEDHFWIEGKVADIKFDIQRRLGRHLPCAIVDAPPEPRLKSLGDVYVFAADSSTLKRDIYGWLRSLGDAGGPTAVV